MSLLKPLVLIALCASLLMTYGTHASTPNDADDDAVQWLQQQTAGQHLLLLGEKHGTREIPRFVAQLVRSTSADEAITLGLEVWRSEQQVLDSYLDSDGQAGAKAELRAGAFWQVANTQHDGRRSADMLDLIEALRQMRQNGRDLRILAFDLAPDVAHDHHLRDRLMADAIRAEAEARPLRTLLVLTGNVHAMRRRPEGAPPEMQQPMGSYLDDLRPISVNITARIGAFWGCRATCAAIRENHPDWASRRTSGVYDIDLVLPEFTVARLLGSAEQMP